MDNADSRTDGEVSEDQQATGAAPATSHQARPSTDTTSSTSTASQPPPYSSDDGPGMAGTVPPPSSSHMESSWREESLRMQKINNDRLEMELRIRQEEHEARMKRLELETQLEQAKVNKIRAEVGLLELEGKLDLMMLTMPGRLAHKTAVVTGAASGIGLETSMLFALEGANVVCADVNLEAATRAVETIKAKLKEANVERAEGKVIAHLVDVAKEEEVKGMIDRAVDEFGRLDVLFNNAGIMHPADDNALNTEDGVWDLTMDINLKGVWWGCKYGIAAMRENEADPSRRLKAGGSIINTASFVALLGAATPQLAYTASKGAVLAMTRELAMVHAREGIRLNSLCPGPLRTPLLMDFLDTAEKKERRLVHVPMGRFGEAIEQAKATLFLASDESSYITGTDFRVDGGISGCYVTPEGENILPPPSNLAAP